MKESTLNHNKPGDPKNRVPIKGSIRVPFKGSYKGSMGPSEITVGLKLSRISETVDPETPISLYKGIYLKS